nr:zinc finger, CCHC-type [Tanacetum cinerariifolium]
MSDPLFDIYQNVESAKELWDSLESKYMAEDASSKKFLTGHFKRDCRSGKKNNANAGGSEKGLMLLRDGLTLVPQLMFVKIVAGLRHMNRWKTDMYFTWRRYKQVYESDKYILSKSGVFVGFGYYNNGHVHYKRMLEMSKYDFIPTIDENPELEGCRAVLRLSDSKMKTLGENGIDCIFVGYAEHSKAYMFYVIEPNDFVSINSIIESRDAIFDDNRFSSIPRLKDNIANSDESQTDDHSNDAPSETPNLVEKEAVNDEIGFIIENNTWVLSNLPPGCKPLGCKRIFKRKMKVDRTIDTFKARLVIQGFGQKERIDYFDTYAPIARITTIRLLLALATIHNLVIHQMDAKTTFLNGDLDEEVYMKQSEGFFMPGNEHKLCKLVKSLYGLKQAPKQWHQKFDEVVGVVRGEDVVMMMRYWLVNVVVMVVFGRGGSGGCDGGGATSGCVPPEMKVVACGNRDGDGVGWMMEGGDDGSGDGRNLAGKWMTTPENFKEICVCVVG